MGLIFLPNWLYGQKELFILNAEYGQKVPLILTAKSLFVLFRSKSALHSYRRIAFCASTVKKCHLFLPQNRFLCFFGQKVPLILPAESLFVFLRSKSATYSYRRIAFCAFSVKKCHSFLPQNRFLCFFGQKELLILTAGSFFVLFRSKELFILTAKSILRLSPSKSAPYSYRRIAFCAFSVKKVMVPIISKQ
jgi:hypothetical protein